MRIRFVIKVYIKVRKKLFQRCLIWIQIEMWFKSTGLTLINVFNTVFWVWFDGTICSIGITIGVRIFGPVCGFLLGSLCTSVYVEFPFGKNKTLI